MASESELANPKIVVYERRNSKDEPIGEYGWRLRAKNGNIIATDGGQGYVNRDTAAEMAEKIIKHGGYANVEIHHMYPKK